MEFDDILGITPGPPLPPMVEGVDYIPGGSGQVMTTPCTYKGMEFESMTAAAKHFDVSVAAVSLYVNRVGCHRYEYPVEYKGKTYKCIAEAAKLNGAKYNSVVAWVRRHNSYIQDGTI